jgi:predicted PurR-regulated permease PerM
MIIIILLIGAQIGTSFSNFITELHSLQARIREQVTELTAFISSKDFVVKEKYFLEYVNPESIMKLTASFLSGLSSVLSD